MQTQIDSAPSLDANATFTENLTCEKTFYIQDKVGNDALFWMAKDGGNQLYRQEHRGSNVRYRLGTSKFYMHDSGRFEFEGTHLQVPASSTTPTGGDLRAGLFLDLNESPPVLKYHNGTSWLTIATV